MKTLQLDFSSSNGHHQTLTVEIRRARYQNFNSPRLDQLAPLFMCTRVSVEYKSFLAGLVADVFESKRIP